MSRVRVVLVDDQTLFLEGLHALLDAQPEVEVVGRASNGEEALALCASLVPDVVLMDLRMPVMDGVATTRRLAESKKVVAEFARLSRASPRSAPLSEALSDRELE